MNFVYVIVGVIIMILLSSASSKSSSSSTVNRKTCNTDQYLDVNGDCIWNPCEINKSRIGTKCEWDPCELSGWVRDVDGNCRNNNAIPHGGLKWEGDTVICKDGYKRYNNYKDKCQAKCLESQNYVDGVCVRKCPTGSIYKKGSCINEVDETGFTPFMNSWVSWPEDVWIQEKDAPGLNGEMCRDKCLKGGDCYGYTVHDTPSKQECWNYHNDYSNTVGGPVKIEGRPSHVYLRNKYL